MCLMPCVIFQNNSAAGWHSELISLIGADFADPEWKIIYKCEALMLPKNSFSFTFNFCIKNSTLIIVVDSP